MAALFSVGMLAYYSFLFRSDQGLDFRMFYAVAQSLRQGGSNALVDHPPITPLIYLPFTFVNIQLAYILWSALSMCVLFVCAALLNRATHTFRDSYWAYLACFVFLPVHILFLQGQIDLIVLLAYVLAFLALRRDQKFLAGLLLALGLFKFHLVLPFAAVMLLRKQWKFVTGFAAGALAFVAVCISAAGIGFLIHYPKRLLKTAETLSSGYSPGMMANLHGLFYLLFLRSDHPLLVLTLSVALLWWVSRRWTSLEGGFAGTVVATVLVSYHLNPHDLLLLLMPLSVALHKIRWFSARGILILALTLPILPRTLLILHLFPLVAILIGGLGFAFFWIPGGHTALRSSDMPISTGST